MENLTGKRFGRWLVMDQIKRPGERCVNLCLCDCGTKREVARYSLLNGDSRSCGCRQVDTPFRTIHGKRKHPLYNVWNHMKNRCADVSYEAYGGRGISVCDEWKTDFQSFYDWAMQSGYKKGLTIERIDVNCGYSPDNCSWIPLQEQNRNKRNSYYVTYKGEKILLRQLCEDLKIPYHRVWQRINRYGWSLEDSLFRKPKSGKDK